MRIISHRGYWLTPPEKNSVVAFRRSFQAGFGTETDVRDLAGELVISHDPPTGGEMPFRAFLDLHAAADPSLPLALNVKADGLQDRLKNVLTEYRVENYFVFDMAVPDALGYLQAEMNAYTRQSEYETAPAFYERAQGVWMDGFHSEWMDAADIRQHLQAGKEVALVSPELHRRAPEAFWERLRAAGPWTGARLPTLCTDRPEECRRLFTECV